MLLRTCKIVMEFAFRRGRATWPTQEGGPTESGRPPSLASFIDSAVEETSPEGLRGFPGSPWDVDQGPSCRCCLVLHNAAVDHSAIHKAPPKHTHLRPLLSQGGPHVFRAGWETPEAIRCASKAPTAVCSRELRGGTKTSAHLIPISTCFSPPQTSR